ncbi:MAG: GNAT family N-acetyltransferase [Kordiimonadaceae bacterium]|nr:GNAT family N-acetyltransferase [Kordiimonadaceae bacterium]
MIISLATSPEDQASVKEVFKAFIEFLPIDMAFQGIDDELAAFPKAFVCLLIAKQGGKPIGAVGLKEHSADVCEMKRLYVLPEGQGTGAGRALCEQLLIDAKAAGYKTILLDSLRRLKPAINLYEKLGFEETEPYNLNLEEDVVYMRRDL